MDMSSVPVVGKAVVGLGLINIALTAAKQILDKVAAGSKADTIVGKACAILAKILSFVTANTQATPAAGATVADQVAAAPAAQPAAEAPQA
jgi:hypothetical protein